MKLEISIRSLALTTSLAVLCLLHGTSNAGELKPARIILDMVHNNPGEEPFDTHYNDPKLLKQLG
jgi:hypothetical protein